MAQKKYLSFQELPVLKDAKTLSFGIYNRGGEYLGKIKWKSGWRRYCLFTDNTTIWDSGCLKEITDFIDDLMENRKTAKHEIHKLS